MPDGVPNGAVDKSSGYSSNCQQSSFNPKGRKSELPAAIANAQMSSNRKGIPHSAGMRSHLAEPWPRLATRARGCGWMHRSRAAHQIDLPASPQEYRPVARDSEG